MSLSSKVVWRASVFNTPEHASQWSYPALPELNICGDYPRDRLQIPVASLVLESRAVGRRILVMVSCHALLVFQSVGCLGSYIS